MDVSTPCNTYSEMITKWGLLHDLLNGTFQMRDAGETWLPREKHEEPKDYENRLDRSFLYEAFANTIEQLTAKPFSRPVTVQNPGKLEGFQWEVNNEGQSLSQFAEEVFSCGITYGVVHILIDYPKSDAKTKEDEVGLRPTFVLVKPPQLLGWRADGVRLTEIRILEKRVEPDGEYGEKEGEYIRVYKTDVWELWKKEGDSWSKVEEGAHSFGDVPLVTYYVKKSKFMMGDPPLEGLAHLNVAHWQSLSDQRNILRFARCGLIFAKGFQEEDMESLIISPNRVIKTSVVEADLKYVEHSGQAIGAGEEDLKRLEERMETLGLKPLLERTAHSTATGKAIDEGRTNSAIQNWIRDLESVLCRAFEYAAKWTGATLPDDFAIDIFNDFNISARGATDLDPLLKLSMERKITDATLLREVKRRGLLSEAVDIDTELASLEAENPMPVIDDEEEDEE